MPPVKKTKRIKRKKAEEIELFPDAWERFEKGLKQIAKKTPKVATKPKK